MLREQLLLILLFAVLAKYTHGQLRVYRNFLDEQDELKFLNIDSCNGDTVTFIGDGGLSHCLCNKITSTFYEKESRLYCSDLDEIQTTEGKYCGFINKNSDISVLKILVIHFLIKDVFPLLDLLVTP